MNRDPALRPQARLTLHDGSVFAGTGFGAETPADGEVVFNTGMVGYPEALTDPSYRGQILVLTYPMAGNYGAPRRGQTDAFGLPQGFESERIQVRGLVVADYDDAYSHWNAQSSLHDWLKAAGVPAITGVDTRALTKLLREHGVMLGRLSFGETVTAGPIADPNQTNLVAEVSCQEHRDYGSQGPRILVVDCGIKANILRSLLRRGVRVTRVPWDYDFSKEDCDGLLVSNGPGDPKMCGPLIARLRAFLAKDRPVFGICLGCQLLGLAAGAETYKLKYGHRGQNQPCNEAGTGRCHITSQNHGYAVAEGSLPRGWKVWFSNGNDSTVEGIRHQDKPFYAVQFHPEACPGPTDTAFLFDSFVKDVQACRK